MIRARVKIEIECTECDGGYLLIPPLDGAAEHTEVTCSFCDGSGFMELFVSLSALKHLIEGGDL